MKKIILFLIITSLLSCKSIRLHKKMSKKLDTSFYTNQFTGILVYNPRTNDTLFNHNANKYFTPASNTKIFTLFTSLEMLGDYIPAFKYQVNKDTISIIGTGNPAFLHSYFKDSTVLKMAKKFKHVTVNLNNLTDENFAPGWAWEDYDAYYSAERTAFPMYGNVLSVSKDDSLLVMPKLLKNKLHAINKKFRRNKTKNEFYYYLNQTKKMEIPMIMDSVLQQKLWRDLLPNVTFTKTLNQKPIQTIYSIKSDSIYQKMMYQSDNFLAEQLLIMASSTLSDTLSSKKVRNYILTHQLKKLKHQPRWVDGSGLSRYNLFTPTSFVDVLTKLHHKIPQKRLFKLFPAGGKSGTLKNWYAGDTTPYIYAKSGSLSNNYSLSGYLLTHKGETLIFSFMNNHYRKPTTTLKKEMQVFFEYLRDTF